MGRGLTREDTLVMIRELRRRKKAMSPISAYGSLIGLLTSVGVLPAIMGGFGF